jgi:NAD(P)-dependent dehydrogenase (short-subunit alcohol dehydrogenase family)
VFLRRLPRRVDMGQQKAQFESADADRFLVKALKLLPHDIDWLNEAKMPPKSSANPLLTVMSLQSDRTLVDAQRDDTLCCPIPTHVRERLGSSLRRVWKQDSLTFADLLQGIGKMRLSGKRAFITGGTSGIGLATAQAFVHEGAMVTITGRHLQRLEEALSVLGSSAQGFAADGDDDVASARAIEAAAQGAGIDILFANAGFAVLSPLGSTTRTELEKQWSVVTNIFMTVQLAVPHLRSPASVIIMGSVYATMGPPAFGAYGASKAAAGAMARSLASELAPRGVRVNVITPGAVDTAGWHMDDMEPEARDRQKRLLGERSLVNRMIAPEEVANAVVFLASDESSGINAAEIIVDGGTTGALAGSPRFIRGEP